MDNHVTNMPEIKVEQYGLVGEKSALNIRKQVEFCYRSLPLPLPPIVKLAIFDTLQRWREYATEQREKTGVMTAGEEGFLATHDVWEGHPQLSVCLERLEGHPKILQQGALHQITAHSVLHGQPKYYRYLIPTAFLSIGQARGMDLEIVQQILYFVALTIKGHEVVSLLVRHGFVEDQVALALYQLTTDEDDLVLWKMARWDIRARILYLSALLKPLLYLKPLLPYAPELARAGQIRLSHLPPEDIERVETIVETLSVRRSGNTHQDVTAALGLVLGSL